MHNSITDVPGILVGHVTNEAAGTGCTVVLCGKGMICGADIRGGSPGTRETDALEPTTIVHHAHALYLGGGSAFGLEGASGVMQYLEEKQIGFDVGRTVVPIVPGAILNDLGVGRFDIRPDKAMGYQACKNAATPNTAQGNVGAGTGARVGYSRIAERSMKGGLGTASIKTGDLTVAALVAVNCYGDVTDHATGELLAGGLTDDRKSIEGNLDFLIANYKKSEIINNRMNTTIGIIATNAKLTQPEAGRVAMIAQDGYARAINPIHTEYDGDAIFCAASGKVDAHITAVGAIAATVMATAIANGVRAAESAYGLLAYADLK
jgi:L-aminopeptidase/D-esterase-like protein